VSGPGRLEVVEVDPDDDAAVDAWHAAYLAAEQAIAGGVASPWQLEEVRALLRDRGSSRWHRGYCGVVDGRVVASGYLRLPLLDNAERAELMVHVAPAHQRRGHGSAMLAHLERVAAGRGRRVLASEATWPYEAGPDGAGQPAAAFAHRHGYTVALPDVKRRLRLPVADGVLDRLAAEAATRHHDFTLRSWEGPVPDELLDGWARLVASLGAEAPQGDLVLEAEAADPHLVREQEELLARQGRRKYNTVALDATGDVVAFTDLATTVHEPGRAYQWGTLVRRDVRGHRLGLAVKVANLRLLEQLRPDVVELTTYNAETNRPMVAVNELLGFEPVARLAELQKVLHG
jgi:GNAT superfamily N-acetyltransferase